MKKQRKPLINAAGEARSLTADDMKHFRPASKADAAFAARWKKTQNKPQDRVRARAKKTISLSLDADIVAALRASGKGWQNRLNDLLRTAKGLLD